MDLGKLNKDCFDQKATDGNRDAVEKLMAQAFVPLTKADLETPKFGTKIGANDLVHDRDRGDTK